MDVDEVLLDTEDRMEKAVEAFRHVLATVRTGRANTALVEHFEVEHYGQTMPLNQLGTLATPDPALTTRQVWAPAAVHPIVPAVQAGGQGRQCGLLGVLHGWSTLGWECPVPMHAPCRMSGAVISTPSGREVAAGLAGRRRPSSLRRAHSRGSLAA